MAEIKLLRDGTVVEYGLFDCLGPDSKLHANSTSLFLRFDNGPWYRNEWPRTPIHRLKEELEICDNVKELKQLLDDGWQKFGHEE